MDRKKKKLAANKAAANIEQQRKALKDRFIYRLKEIIKLIGGHELLNKFTPIYIEKLYECRFPTIKAKSAPGADIPKTRIVQFHKLMHQLMEGQEIPLQNGNKIPLAWYMAEGQTLVDAVEEMDITVKPEIAEIKACFEYYFFDGHWQDQIRETIDELVTETCRYLNDFNDCLYRVDFSMTPYFARFNPKNDFIIHTFKAKAESIQTKDGLRNAIRLGWPDRSLQWHYFNVKPSALGFKTIGFDIPLDVYITEHALGRLKQRINITPGVMHEILMYTFLQKEIPHRWNGYESLVDFFVADQKVGYLTVRLHESIFVIHTFLFLTNNGTPEGEKLSRLLDIEKMDKKYLEIDTLPTFNSYHISGNEKLSQLFKDAGCGSLLKLGHLQAFTENEVKDKDPESILKYLADAPYFRRLSELN